MDDNKRTAFYAGAAVLALLAAWEPWASHSAVSDPIEQTGKLFPKFTDPLAAQNMQIVKYDEDTGTARTFQVAQVNGLWSIPSHQNYPADAKDHLANAAAALMDLNILTMASDSPGDHKLYGVIEPNAKAVSDGDTGIGTRVTLKDGKDDVLADLVIGKEDKGQPDVRFVRRAGYDQVYRVAIKTDKLSTKFGDWIEKDLLKLSAFDIGSVDINDYTTGASMTLDGRIGLDQLKRSQMKLDYDDAKNTWKLDELVEFDEEMHPKEAKLADDEELNTEKLNGLKSALDDLQIVDVERKPAGIRDLQVAADLVQSREVLESLAKRGFYPVGARGGGIELLSSEGEVVCNMKDGVEYVLRFGRFTGGEDDKPEAAAEAKEGQPASRVNRYLFVMAQFSPDLIPKPALETLPGDEKPEGTEEKDAAEKSAEDAGDKSPEAKAADAEAAAEDAAERKKADTEKRAAIEKENKRKQQEYDDKVKKGEQHVKDLNERFTDWYYIISDDVYRKIHLSRADVVKTKQAKPGEGNTPIDLKQLEQKGLK